MNTFVATLALVACAYGAPMPEADPQFLQGGLGLQGLGLGLATAPVALGQTHHTFAAGPPIVRNHVEFGVVGHEVRQVGVQQVQTGHQFHIAGVETIPQPAHTFVAGPAKNTVQTVAIAPPAIPHAPLPLLAIPPAPVNWGPAPADTVTQTRVLAPVRTHTRITPQVTQIIPELNLVKFNVDVPVNVPVPVERVVLVDRHVPEPFEVAVPRAVPVPQPFEVNPVFEIVETPHIHTATHTTHQTAVHHAVSPIATVAAAPVVAAPFAGHLNHGFAGFAGQRFGGFAGQRFGGFGGFGGFAGQGLTGLAGLAVAAE